MCVPCLHCVELLLLFTVLVVIDLSLVDPSKTPCPFPFRPLLVFPRVACEACEDPEDEVRGGKGGDEHERESSVE